MVAWRSSTSGPYMTAVGAGEMLTEIRIPVRPGAGSAHEKVERRAGDWAIAAASAAVWIDGGTIADAGIALSGRRPDHDPRSARRGAAAREGALGASCSRRPARSPPRTATPVADGRGPVDYKRHLAGVLTHARCAARARARALHQEA